MSRRPAPDPMDDALEDDLDAPGGRDGQAGIGPDLTTLPIVGITRRRMAILMSALLAAWIVLAFARQVSEASDAMARAQDIASTNAATRLEVAALERELELIARQRYIEQQARAYGLGGSSETPFSLAVGAPALPADAPGSAALRVGVRTDGVVPFDRWLTVLFGPSD